MIRNLSPTFQYIYDSSRADAFQEVVDWCAAEVKRVKHHEQRANENTGAGSKIQSLNRTRRVFQLKLKKLQDEMSKEPIRF